MIIIDEKNKKKTIAGIVAAAVLIAVAIIGIVLYQNAPTQRLKKQLSLGDKYLAELKYEDAIGAYEAALQIDAKSEPAYVGISKAYIGLENYDKALDSVNRGMAAVGETEALVALQNQIADHYEAMGDQYLSEMNYEQAAAAYVAVLGIRKGAEDPYVGLANAYIGEEEYTKALDTVEEGIDDVGETPKLVELKTKIEELLNPPVGEPEPEDTVSENEIEQPEGTQETEDNASAEEPVAEETAPAPEAVQESVVESPVAQTAKGGQVALPDGTVISSGGTIPLSQLSSATYVMEGNLWLAVLMDSVPNSYSEDPMGVWAFDGNYGVGTSVPVGQISSWAAGDPYYTWMTIVTASNVEDESTYREKSFRIAR